jgi:hypothetical protein
MRVVRRPARGASFARVTAPLRILVVPTELLPSFALVTRIETLPHLCMYR